MTTITVTWMDGVTEVHTCYAYRLADGVLYLNQRANSGKDRVMIPIRNVRFWTSDDRGC